MKKNLILLFLLLNCLPMAAQQESVLFKHFSLGVGAGTTGVTVDLGTTLTSHLQLRAGMNFMPKVSIKGDLDLSSASGSSPASVSIPSNINVEAKLNWTDFHALLDLYPSKSSSFHFTVGLYAGKESMLTAENTNRTTELAAIHSYNQQVSSSERIGVQLGDYLLEPDASGKVNAELKINSIKPYVGLGFGRAVPKKSVSVMLEMGCYLWGTPKIYCQGEELSKIMKKTSDEGKTLKTLSEIPVYPVLKLSIHGKLF